MPSISIITICFNNPDDLRATCASVDGQLLPPFQHFIIDGSTNTQIKEWLNTTPQPAYRSWLCEPDKGISDAFNKGIQRATGQIIYLLNSGDLLYDNTVLQTVTNVFNTNNDLMWCNGLMELHRAGRNVIIGRSFNKNKLYRGMNRVLHPTMYLRKEVYEKHGLFNTQLKIAMDYDLLCRIANEKNGFIPKPLAIFDAKGVSTRQFFNSQRETHAVYRKYFGYSLKQQLWYMRLSILYYLMNSPAGKLLFTIKVKLGLANA